MQRNDSLLCFNSASFGQTMAYIIIMNCYNQWKTKPTIELGAYSEDNLGSYGSGVSRVIYLDV